MRRAACASVRTGIGPSFAAMPPNSPRVTSVVSAPSSAARRAAMTPAGPAPITTSFKRASWARRNRSVRVVDDEPEVVPLDHVPGEEFPLRPHAERPMIPRRPAALGARAEVAIRTRVGARGTPGLPAQLPRREAGDAQLQRALRGHDLADAPVDDEIAPGLHPRALLLEVLLEPLDRGDAPVVTPAAGIPGAAGRVDKRLEPGAAIVVRARGEPPRRGPVCELELVVVGGF